MEVLTASTEGNPEGRQVSLQKSSSIGESARRVLVAAITFAAVLVVSATPVSSHATDADFTILALGDSYSAGNNTAEGLRDNYDHAGRDCHRTEKAFVHQLADGVVQSGWAARNGYQTVTTRLRACSGAVVNSSRDTGAPHIWDQLEGVETDVELVTVTGGGNDVKFANIVKDCMTDYLLGNCRHALNFAEDGLDGTVQDVEALLRAVLTEYPNAEVVYVGYPLLLGVDARANCGFFLGSSCPDYVDEIRDFGVRADGLMAELVARIQNTASSGDRLHYVSLTEAFAGREMWAQPNVDDEWILRPGTAIGSVLASEREWAHPNVRGHQETASLIQALVERELSPPAPAAVSTALVVDSSGSMTSNDPQNRRLDAARAFVAASLPNDEVGVVDFDGGARVYSEAVQVDANRSALDSAIGQINSSGSTNLGLGLDTGCGVLERSSGARRAAIFFTDGRGAYSGQARCFVDRGWQVHTVGLGSSVDQALLQRIADETGGSYRQLDTATNLVCEFQQIRAQIAGQAPGSCAATGTIAQDEVIQFVETVRNALLQLSFTTTWTGSDIQMTLTSPSGRTYDRSTQANDAVVLFGSSFETITITAPEAGQWTVELLGAEIPPGGEPFSFSTLELGDSVPVTPTEHLCESENGVILVQTGNALCDSGPGGVATARGDGAEALAYGTDSRATAFGPGSYAETGDGTGNVAVASGGGRAEAIGGDFNRATATSSTAIAGGGDRNTALATKAGYAEAGGGDQNRATSSGGIAVALGERNNTATANGVLSSAVIEAGAYNRATAGTNSFARIASGERNNALASGDFSEALIFEGSQNRATARTGGAAVVMSGDRSTTVASLASLSVASGSASRATSSNQSEAYACDGARVVSTKGEVVLAEGCEAVTIP